MTVVTRMYLAVGEIDGDDWTGKVFLQTIAAATGNERTANGC